MVPLSNIFCTVLTCLHSSTRLHKGMINIPGGTTSDFITLQIMIVYFISGIFYIIYSLSETTVTETADKGVLLYLIFHQNLKYFNGIFVLHKRNLSHFVTFKI